MTRWNGRISIRLQLRPGSRDVAAPRPDPAKVFIIVEIEAPIHLDGLGNAGAHKVIAIDAAAPEGKSGVGTIDDADESGVSAEPKSRIAGQSKILEVQSISGSIDHTLPPQAGRGRGRKDFQALGLDH